MYPTAQERPAIEAAEKMMIDTMARYDPSHDAYHVQRVRKTALVIAQNVATQPDLLVVELAALLHDVLDKKYVTPEEATDPYTFFLPFFTYVASTHGVDLIQDGRGRLITDIIDNVSWSTEKEIRAKGLWTKWHDECVELHCVQDADRLDAIGAFGIMRCAAYSAVTNRTLHAPAGDPAQAHSAIRHFYDKLVHIHDRLKTVHGKLLGAKRHQVLLDFLGSVMDEYEAK